MTRIATILTALVLLASPARAQAPRVDLAVFQSGARTTTVTSGEFTNEINRGAQLLLNVTAASGTTPTLDVKLQWKDALSGEWVDIPGAAFQRITATGQRTLMVYPNGEGAGVVRAVTGADPAAGAESTETVTADRRWRLLSWRISLVTDGTAANRIPAFVVDDGATAYGRFPGGTQTASTTAQHTFSDVGAASTANGLVSPFAGQLILPGGHRLATSTSNIQAGDNYGAPTYLIEEWVGNYASATLPRVWRAVATIGGTDPSFTFSVGGNYIQ